MEIEPKHNCKEWALVCPYISVDVYCTCALVSFHSPLPTIPGPSHFKLLLSLWYGFQDPQRSFTTLLSPVLNWLKFERINSGYSEPPLFCLGGFPAHHMPTSQLGLRPSVPQSSARGEAINLGLGRQVSDKGYSLSAEFPLILAYRLWRFSWLTAITTLDIFRVFAFFF